MLNYNIYNIKRSKMISLKTLVVVLPGLATFTGKHWEN